MENKIIELNVGGKIFTTNDTTPHEKTIFPHDSTKVCAITNLGEIFVS
jgi:hypothetical protein